MSPVQARKRVTVQRGCECGREADLQPCAALPIWTWSNRIPSDSGPRSSRRPSAFATRMRRPGAGGHLGEITGTGGAVFDNVHDARLSDSRIRGFESIDFRKNVLGRHEGGPQSLSFAKGSLPVTCTYRRPRLPAIFDGKTPALFAKPFFTAISIGKAPSQILHAL